MTCVPTQYTVPAAVLPRRIVCVALGIELLVASILKTSDEPHYSSLAAHFTSLERFDWKAAIECIVAIWLLTGVCFHKGHLVARILFMCFVFANLFHIITGAESCGCFGALKVSPWYALIANMAAILALSLVPPTETTAPKRTETLRMALVLFGGLACYGSIIQLAAALGNSPVSPVVGATGEMIIDRDRWLGHHLNIAHLVDLDADLAAGTWVVVFLRANCEKCIHEMPRHEMLADEMADSGAVPRVAFIDIQADAPRNPSGPARCRSCVYGRIKSGSQMYIPTPTIVTISDGVVTRLLESLPHRESAFWGTGLD